MKWNSLCMGASRCKVQNKSAYCTSETLDSVVSTSHLSFTLLENFFSRLLHSIKLLQKAWMHQISVNSCWYKLRAILLSFQHLKYSRNVKLHHEKINSSFSNKMALFKTIYLQQAICTIQQVRCWGRLCNMFDRLEETIIRLHKMFRIWFSVKRTTFRITRRLLLITEPVHNLQKTPFARSVNDLSYAYWKIEMVSRKRKFVCAACRI